MHSLVRVLDVDRKKLRGTRTYGSNSAYGRPVGVVLHVFLSFRWEPSLSISLPRPFVVWQRFRADIIAIAMDTPAPLRVIPTKLDQTTPVPVPAEEVNSTYKRGNLPFRGPPTTELGLGKRKARTPPAEGDFALGKRKARTPAAKGGATAAESPTSKTKRISRVPATSTSEKKKRSKASEGSEILATSGAEVTATIEPPLPYDSIREGGNLSVQDHSQQQRVPQNDGAEASDEVAGGSGPAVSARCQGSICFVVKGRCNAGLAAALHHMTCFETTTHHTTSCTNDTVFLPPHRFLLLQLEFTVGWELGQ